MRDRLFKRVRASALAAVLLGWSFVSPRVPMAWRVPAQAGFAGLLVTATRAPVGLGPPRVWSGLRWGSVAGALAAGSIAATASAPAVRRSMGTRELPNAAPIWLAVRIPLGTVWAEEAAFRAAMASAAAEAFGASAGRLLQAATFGLSHIPDALAGTEPVARSVVATGVAGWLFGWLADRSGSLAAPMLVHLAINETAAAAALIVQRRGDQRLMV